MPQALAALAVATFDALTTVGVPAATAASIATATIVGAEVAAVVGTAAELAKLLKSPTPEGMRQTVRQAIPSRRRGVGVARGGGAYLLDYANALNDLFRITAIIDGPVTGISRYYLSQDRVQLGSSGVVIKTPGGSYNDDVQIFTQYGRTGVPSFTAIASHEGGANWSASDSGTGIFMAGFAAVGGNISSFTTNFPRGKPQLNIVGKMGVAYDWRDDAQSQTDPTTWTNTTNAIVGWVHELWAYRGYDWALDFLPALDDLTAEANVCDEEVAYLNVITQTVVFTASGNNYLVLDPSGPLPPTGVTINVGGQVTTVTNGNAGPFTFNGYTGTKVILADNLVVGVPVQSPIRWQRGSGSPVTEPRYAVGGIWETTEAEKDTVKKFKDACDGWMERRASDGAVIIRCGHFIAPTVTIGPDEIVSYTWDEFPRDGNVINQILPAVVHPAFDFSQVDTTVIEDDTSIEANGESNQAFKPDFVQSNGQVMRLAYRRLAQLLQPIQTVTLKRSGIRALGQRFIEIDFGSDGLGLVTVERCGKTEIIDGGMHVRMAVRLVDPDTIDAYDPYTMEGDGPAATAPQPGPGQIGLTAPTITAVTYTTTIAPGGGSPNAEFLEVVVTPPAAQATRTDLTWLVRWQVSGDTTWSPPQSFPGLPAGVVTIDKIGPVPTAGELLVEAAFQTGGGLLSDWSAPADVARGLITPGGVTLETPGGTKLTRPT